MDELKVFSVGISVCSAAVMAVTSPSLYTLSPQVFLINAIVGATFALFTQMGIHMTNLRRVNNFFCPVVLGFSAIMTLDLFNTMHSHLLISWPSIQNQICGDAGGLVGYASVLLVANLIYNVTNLIFPNKMNSQGNKRKYCQLF
jgi:hypothetical protein